MPGSRYGVVSGVDGPPTVPFRPRRESLAGLLTGRVLEADFAGTTARGAPVRLTLALMRRGVWGRWSAGRTGWSRWAVGPLVIGVRVE